MGQEVRYLQDAQTAKIFDLVLQLATELHVERHRLRALEELLVRKGVVDAGAVDNFLPRKEEAPIFDGARADYLARLMRIITESGPAEHPLREQWEELLARSRTS